MISENDVIIMYLYDLSIYRQIRPSTKFFDQNKKNNTTYTGEEIISKA